MFPTFEHHLIHQILEVIYLILLLNWEIEQVSDWLFDCWLYVDPFLFIIHELIQTLHIQA